MAIISGSEVFTDVVQIETTDIFAGGVGGKANESLVAMANRTAYNKGRIDRQFGMSGYQDLNNVDLTILPQHYGKFLRLSAASAPRTFDLPAVAGVPDGTIIGFENAAGAGTRLQILANTGAENFKSSIGNINYSIIYLPYLMRAVVMKIGGIAGGWLLLEHDNAEVGHIQIIPDLGPVEKQGYLECNGALYSIVAAQPYRRLFDKIGNNYGGTPGSTFAVPTIAPIVTGSVSNKYYIKY